MMQKIVAAKIDICRKYGCLRSPRIRPFLPLHCPEERETLRKILLVKPSRTLSGVAPVAVMTSPYPCPHGKCLPCPGGPDHPFHSPQSYTGEEPAAKRAREHDFDPFRQVHARLEQFEILGHRVDKVELIVMGGTMTARPVEYQQEFVSRCIEAMNTYPGGSPAAQPIEIHTVEDANEDSAVRCVAITFETRPDWCKREHIDRMLDYGVTKVELGVQHVDDAILTFNRRGCTVADTVEANTLLRDAGLKVGFHMMPNLPGSSIESDRQMFETLFADPRFRPDFLKIYPTLVTPGSEIEDLWQRGLFSPYDEDELIDLIAYGKSLIPEYTRLQRIQRDIPAKLIVAGSKHSNFRQLAQNRLKAQGNAAAASGAGRSGGSPRLPNRRSRCWSTMPAAGRSISSPRSRMIPSSGLPGSASRPWSTARNLRVLRSCGNSMCTAASSRSGWMPRIAEWQHRNYGRALIARAEEIAAGAGFRQPCHHERDRGPALLPQAWL